MRVVIDTNIWISFLIGKTLIGLRDAIISGRITILFSEELFAELIEITRHFDDCRDKKDNFLLDLSVSGHADYLVTGDDDLLTLNPFYGIEIVSYRTFQNSLSAI